MSTELAVTAVTEALRRVLEDEVEGKWGADVLSGDLTKDRVITTLPLHKVRDLHATENVLNVFLYRTDLSAAWRNLAPPVQGQPGQNGAAPLALSLEYLITAYGEDEREEVAHYFLAQAMRILHDLAMVPRQRLAAVLAKARVQDQIERITVTPRPLSIEEMSKLWSVFQTQYRVSAAYLVTVVLIDSRVVTRAALPVLTRGPGDRGVVTMAGRAPAIGTVTPATRFTAARLGEDVLIHGDRLEGGVMTARLRHRLMSRDEAHVLAVAAVSASEAKITLPSAAPGSGVAAAWPAGVYSVSVEVARPDGDPWTTNSAALLLAPTLSIGPATVQPPVAAFELVIDAVPQVRPGQDIVVLFDDRPAAHKPLAPPAGADAPSVIAADVPGDRPGLHRVRLRVDGIESIAVVGTGATAAFDANQSVEVKP